MEEQVAQGQTAAQTNEVTRTWTEAPYSGNVRAKLEGFDWQFTVRAETGKELIDKANGLMKWLADKHAEKSNGGNGHVALVPATPVASVPVPPPPPSQPTAQAQSTTVQCQMIEVGTSYQGNKTQLKFHCNGMDKPLTYTKSVDEMAKLLAPLGYTVAHIVVGQKYPASALVTYIPKTNTDGKTYNNIVSVKVA